MFFVIFGALFEEGNRHFDVAIGEVLGEVGEFAFDGGEFGLGWEDARFFKDKFWGEFQGMGDLTKGGFIWGTPR